MNSRMSTPVLRILVVDDHELTRNGVLQILAEISGTEQLHTAASGAEALSLASASRYDVCILDLELPDMSGLQLIPKIRAILPVARIIINTMHEEVWIVRQLLLAGVDAVILKSSDAGELKKAVKSVLRGEKYFCRRFEKICKSCTSAGYSSDIPQLTKRETEVLQAIVNGHNTNEIASLMFLSTNTIETHRKNLMTKLNARNVAEMVVKAISQGLVAIEIK